MSARTRFERQRESERLPLGIGYVTKREREAIEMYVAGETPSTAGPMLGINYRTVEALMRNARDRTGAKTNCQLVGMYVTAIPLNGRGRSSKQVDSVARRVNGASQ
jgi:DNA-binding CsgD family transcriptional regulator